MPHLGKGSEYEIPIFISSTVYNLVDLRGELESYLSELGYKPILSSSEGFHDNSPEVQPWESCLQVLETCFIMVLIIDRKYGKKFKWTAFENIIGKVEVSPTHAEYLFAQATKKRILVFVREDLEPYYQIYRKCLKKNNKDKDKTSKELADLLPEDIEMESLEFFGEVKTTNPIPWIKSFKDVTDIKKEIKKKMLNELAEIFLLKEQHLQTVLRIFTSSIDALPDEKRKEVLESLGVTKELQQQIDAQSKEIETLKEQKKKVEDELEGTKKEVIAKKPTAKQAEKIQAKEQELKDLNIRIGTHKSINSDLIVGSSRITIGDGGTLQISPGVYLGTGPTGIRYEFPKVGDDGIIRISGASPVLNIPGSTCDKCKSIHLSSSASGALRHCTNCNRNLCSSCFNGGDFKFRAGTMCNDCSS